MILKLLVNAVAVLLSAYLLKGVEVKNFFSALLTAMVLALANALVRPVLAFLAFPLTLLTLGLFTLVIDALILMLVDALLPGLKIKNFGWALLFGILLSLINSLISWIVL
ncbi:MAG: phage holin family protein [Cyclobacteriaceae bacterium]